MQKVYLSAINATAIVLSIWAIAWGLKSLPLAKLAVLAFAVVSLFAVGGLVAVIINLIDNRNGYTDYHSVLTDIESDIEIDPYQNYVPNIRE